MSVYLLPYGEWDEASRIFEFDAALEESRDDSWKWSSYALESGAEVSDYGVEEPVTYEVKGVVVGSLATTDGEVTTRVPDLHRALVEYAKTRQPVTLVTGLWSADVVITKVSAKRDTSTGEALEISISLQTYEIATYTDVEIPPELLAPPVKDSGQEKGDGGEGATSEDEEDFDPSAKTAGASLADGDNPYEATLAAIDTFSQ